VSDGAGLRVPNERGHRDGHGGDDRVGTRRSSCRTLEVVAPGTRDSATRWAALRVLSSALSVITAPMSLQVSDRKRLASPQVATCGKLENGRGYLLSHDGRARRGHISEPGAVPAQAVTAPPISALGGHATRPPLGHGVAEAGLNVELALPADDKRASRDDVRRSALPRSLVVLGMSELETSPRLCKPWLSGTQAGRYRDRLDCHVLTRDVRARRMLRAPCCWRRAGRVARTGSSPASCIPRVWRAARIGPSRRLG
jgi:hypothetical protein